MNMRRTRVQSSRLETIMFSIEIRHIYNRRQLQSQFAVGIFRFAPHISVLGRDVRCRLNHELRCNLPSVVGRWSVENQLGYLSTLNPGSIGALGTTLKLKVYTTDSRLRHTLLTEEAQFSAIQYRTSRVRTFRFDLYRIFKVHVKRVTRTIGEKFRIVLRQNVAESLQFYLNVVVRSTG